MWLVLLTGILREGDKFCFGHDGFMVSVAFGQDFQMEISSWQLEMRSEFPKRGWYQERQMQKSRDVDFEFMNSPHSDHQAFNLIKCCEDLVSFNLLWLLVMYICGLFTAWMWFNKNQYCIILVWPGLGSMFSRRSVLGQFSHPICESRSSYFFSKL